MDGVIWNRRERWCYMNWMDELYRMEQDGWMFYGTGKKDGDI